MRLPGAFSDFHVREHRLEAGIFRAAGIDPEPDLSRSFPHVADAHLREHFPVLRAFDAVIILAPAEPIPHDLHISRDRRRRPVGIAVIRHHRPQVLKRLIFILHGALQPVIRIQIHHDSALVEPVMALRKIRLHNEREELLLRLHLERRRIVISEMIISPLPQIRMGFCRDLDPVRQNSVLPGFPCPLQFVCHHNLSLRFRCAFPGFLLCLPQSSSEIFFNYHVFSWELPVTACSTRKVFFQIVLLHHAP